MPRPRALWPPGYLVRVRVRVRVRAKVRVRDRVRVRVRVRVRGLALRCVSCPSTPMASARFSTSVSIVASFPSWVVLRVRARIEVRGARVRAEFRVRARVRVPGRLLNGDEFVVQHPLCRPSHHRAGRERMQHYRQAMHPLCRLSPRRLVMVKVTVTVS